MVNILLTSAGGPAVVGVIKSFKDINCKIVTIDCDKLSVGFYLSDVYYIVPNWKDKYGEFLIDLKLIIERENIELILPTGSDIIPISKNKEFIESLGAKLFMSDYDTIKLCNDKWNFYETCKEHFKLPHTSLKVTEFPIFVKPRMEQGGSRGAFICSNQNQIDNDYENIYQEILPGQEYTIDVLCDMESNPLAIIPRKRLQTKAGISTKGEIIKDHYIENECYNICKFLKLKGPICIQMKEDNSGVPAFIEINPRFGGGTYFTTLAGINFCEIIIDIIDNKKPIIRNPNLITVLRYFEEIVIWN